MCEHSKPGTRVAAWRDPGGRRQGCYAEYVALKAAHVLPVPEAMPPEQLASLELAMCVQGSINQLLARGPLAGKHVAVAGLGPAGLLATQLLKAHGAQRVTAIEPHAARRTLGLQLGANHAVAPTDESLPDSRTSATSFDYGLDTTGLKIAIEALMAGTRFGVAIFGVLREQVHFGPAQWWGGFSLMGYSSHTLAQAETALQHIKAGSLNLAPLITHYLPLTEYKRGVDLLRDKSAIKVLFYP